MLLWNGEAGQFGAQFQVDPSISMAGSIVIGKLRRDKSRIIWVVVSNIFLFSPILGNDSHFD